MGFGVTGCCITDSCGAWAGALPVNTCEYIFVGAYAARRPTIATTVLWCDHVALIFTGRRTGAIVMHLWPGYGVLGHAFKSARHYGQAMVLRMAPSGLEGTMSVAPGRAHYASIAAVTERY